MRPTLICMAAPIHNPLALALVEFPELAGRYDDQVERIWRSCRAGMRIIFGSRRSRSDLRCRQIDFMRRGIERHGASAFIRRHIANHGILVRAFLLYYCERTALPIR